MMYFVQHKSPITAEDLEPLFPKGLIAQEMSTESYIDIPQEVISRSFLSESLLTSRNYITDSENASLESRRKHTHSH